MSIITFYRRIVQKKLTPNQHFVLSCLERQVDLTDLEAQGINVHKELRALKLQEYIDNTNKVLETGKSALRAIRKSLKEPEKSITIDDEFRKNIQKYVSLFPQGRLPSDSYARVSPKNLESRFEWFFQTFSYSWTTVLKATELYIKEHESASEKYKYMRTSKYFIKKTDRGEVFSDLADYCDMVDSGVESLDDIPKRYDKDSDSSFGGKAI